MPVAVERRLDRGVAELRLDVLRMRPCAIRRLAYVWRRSKDAPEPRSVHAPCEGTVVEVPRVGGLHHLTADGFSAVTTYSRRVVRLRRAIARPSSSRPWNRRFAPVRTFSTCPATSGPSPARILSTNVSHWRSSISSSTERPPLSGHTPCGDVRSFRRLRTHGSTMRQGWSAYRVTVSVPAGSISSCSKPSGPVASTSTWNVRPAA